MNFLKLEDIKAQARIDYDYEDDLLRLYGEAAEAKIYEDTGYSYNELMNTHGGTFPQPLKLAALLLTSTWFAHRESIDNLHFDIVPYTYENLITPYMKLTY